MQAVAETPPAALILDLRFAHHQTLEALRLVEYICETEVGVAVGLGRNWFVNRKPVGNDLIGRAQAMAAPRFEGYDFSQWVSTLRREPIVRLTARPAAKRYAGPVYLLVDSYTGGLLLPVARALVDSGRVEVVGDKRRNRVAYVVDQAPLDSSLSLRLPIAQIGSFPAQADGGSMRVAITVFPDHERNRRRATLIMADAAHRTRSTTGFFVEQKTDPLLEQALDLARERLGLNQPPPAPEAPPSVPPTPPTTTPTGDEIRADYGPAQ